VWSRLRGVDVGNAVGEVQAGRSCLRSERQGETMCVRGAEKVGCGADVGCQGSDWPGPKARLMTFGFM
jgi:hypothetical protein